MSADSQPPAGEPAGPGPEGVTRRAFVGLAATAAGCTYAGMIGYPVYRYLASPVEKAEAEAQVREVAIAGAQTLAPGAARGFLFGGAPALLIHLPGGEWIALSAVCTHLGCPVEYEPGKGRIYCNCHGGTYDPSTGRNVGGPPPRPLEKFTVEVGKDSVVVKRG